MSDVREFRSADRTSFYKFVHLSSEPAVLRDYHPRDVPNRTRLQQLLEDYLLQTTTVLTRSAEKRFSYDDRGEPAFQELTTSGEYAVQAIRYPRVGEFNFIRQMPFTNGILSPIKPFTELAPNGKQLDCHLWMGSNQCTTPFHCDGWHNLIWQLTGTKNLLLAPSNEYERMYPYDIDTSRVHVSRVNPVQFDSEMFPAFSGVEVKRITLTEGDLLYLPPFWWHEASSVGISLMVNAWWNCEPEEFIVRSATGFLRQSYIRCSCNNIGVKDGATAASDFQRLAARAFSKGMNVPGVLLISAAFENACGAQPWSTRSLEQSILCPSRLRSEDILGANMRHVLANRDCFNEIRDFAMQAAQNNSVELSGWKHFEDALQSVGITICR